MNESPLVQLAQKFLAALSEYQNFAALCSGLEQEAAKLAEQRSAGGNGAYLADAELARAEQETGLTAHEQRLSDLIRELDSLALEMIQHKPKTLEEFGALAVLTAWAENESSDAMPAWQPKWQVDLKEAVLRFART